MARAEKASADMEVTTEQPAARPKRQARNVVQHVPKSPAAKSPKAKKATASPKIPKVKTPSTHPTYLKMVTDAILDIKDRKGASSQSILKHIKTNHKLVTDAHSEKQVKKNFKAALLKGVSSGIITQSSGKGINGRFQIKNKKHSTPKKSVSRSTDEVKSAEPAVMEVPSTPKTKRAPKKADASSSEKKTKSPMKAAKPVVKKGKKTATKQEATATTPQTA